MPQTVIDHRNAEPLSPVRIVEEDAKEDSPNLTTAQLNALVPKRDLAEVVGWSTNEEKEASNPVFNPAEFRVVKLSDIAEIRIDDGEQFQGLDYLSIEDARTILPASFDKRVIEGTEYPAVKHPPITRVTGYTSEQIESAKNKLAAFREREEEARLVRVAQRDDYFERWRNGEKNLSLVFEETIRNRRDGNQTAQRPI